MFNPNHSFTSNFGTDYNIISVLHRLLPHLKHHHEMKLNLIWLNCVCACVCSHLSSSIYRVETQLTSTIYFIRKVIEYADLPQKITENLLCIMRPGLMDFHESSQSWIESTAPYVDYLHSIYQQTSTKDGNSQNQFYDNFSFRNDNFSLTRFSKQLRHILSVLVSIDGNGADDKRTMEKALATMEEDEMKIDESEWSSKIVDPTHEIMPDNDINKE